LYKPYVEALKHELFDLAKSRNDRQLASLFIGGGTPTVLPSSLLMEIVGYCLELFPPHNEVEITIEANPGTIDESYLHGLLFAGVNRLSMGIQSFNDQELYALGRLHDCDQACRAIESAKKVGFKNINLDLMYGLPGQTVGSWSDSLKKAARYRPQHLSLYQLTIEEGTPFYELVAHGKLFLPSEDEILEMDEVTTTLCRDENFQQYEISNFANPGYECFHNINYWKNGEYLACGASAVSSIGGVREKRIADTLQYISRIKAGGVLIEESECLLPEAAFRESVIMGLRMTKGVSILEMAARFQIDLVKYYGNILEKLINLQLVELAEAHLRLTTKGRPLANLILAELV